MLSHTAFAERLANLATRPDAHLILPSLTYELTRYGLPIGFGERIERAHDPRPGFDLKTYWYCDDGINMHLRSVRFVITPYMKECQPAAVWANATLGRHLAVWRRFSDDDAGFEQTLHDEVAGFESSDYWGLVGWNADGPVAAQILALYLAKTETAADGDVHALRHVMRDAEQTLSHYATRAAEAEADAASRAADVADARDDDAGEGASPDTTNTSASAGAS